MTFLGKYASKFLRKHLFNKSTLYIKNLMKRFYMTDLRNDFMNGLIYEFESYETNL